MISNESLKWVGVTLQFVGYVFGFVTILRKKENSITSYALLVTFCAFAITTIAGVGLSIEAARNIANANRQASEANQKAETATFLAAKLGVSQQRLNEFVTEQEHHNNDAIKELKESTVGLNKARNEALAAAARSQGNLRSLETALAAQRALTDKIEQIAAQRVLSTEQIKSIVGGLRKFPFGWATVIPQWSSSEVTSLAAQIAEILDRLKNEPGAVNLTLAHNRPGPSGVSVQYFPGNLTGKVFSEEFARLLTANGIKASVSPEKVGPGPYLDNGKVVEPSDDKLSIISVWVGLPK